MSNLHEASKYYNYLISLQDNYHPGCISPTSGTRTYYASIRILYTYKILLMIGSSVTNHAGYGFLGSNIINFYLNTPRIRMLLCHAMLDHVNRGILRDV